MSAVLKEAPAPIAAKVITAPRYDNTNLSNRGWWVADNISVLRDYWHAMGPGGDMKDWDNFCWTQWDRQDALKHENRSTLRQY